MSPEAHPNRARPMMTETPEMRAERARRRAMGVKPPTADEVRASIRSDAERVLVPYSRKAQRQRGLTKKLARTKIGNDNCADWDGPSY